MTQPIGELSTRQPAGGGLVFGEPGWFVLNRKVGHTQPCKFFHSCPRFVLRGGVRESHQTSELRIEEVTLP